MYTVCKTAETGNRNETNVKDISFQAIPENSGWSYDLKIAVMLYRCIVIAAVKRLT